MYLFVNDSSAMPLRVALVILGVSNIMLGYKAIKGSRVAWAFLTATCGTLAAVCLFGAPTMRDQLATT